MVGEGPGEGSGVGGVGKEVPVGLTRANVGFAYMTGARNFAHFAAESTLDLLSRRRIRMWFVRDRDEISDIEVSRMLDRVGGRARLKVLSTRELRNYLLNGNAVLGFLSAKLKLAARQGTEPAIEEKRWGLSCY